MDAPTSKPPITPQQRAVLRLIAEGRRYAEIADELGLSRHTVKAYVERMFQRLGVYSKAGAVGVALREGLLEREFPHAEDGVVVLPD